MQASSSELVVAVVSVPVLGAMASLDDQEFLMLEEVPFDEDPALAAPALVVEPRLVARPELGALIQPQADFEHIVLQLHAGSGNYVITDKRTADSIVLSHGCWDLMDVDGFAFLAKYAMDDPNGDEDPLETAFACDMLKWQVFQQSGGDGNGNVFVIARQGVGAHENYSRTLVEFRSEGYEVDIDFPVGACSRGGCVMWWKLSHLHSICGLASAGGDGVGATGWVQRRFLRWQQFLQSCGLGHAISRGRGHGDIAVGDPERSQEWPVATSVGLFALLCRMRFNNKRNGGIERYDDKQAMSLYLDGFLKSLNCSPWSFEVCWEDAVVSGAILGDVPCGRVGPGRLVSIAGWLWLCEASELSSCVAPVLDHNRG